LPFGRSHAPVLSESFANLQNSSGSNAANSQSLSHSIQFSHSGTESQSGPFDDSVSLTASTLSLRSDGIGGSDVKGLSDPVISSPQLQFSPSVESAPMTLSASIVSRERLMNSLLHNISNVADHWIKLSKSDFNSESSSLLVLNVLSGSHLMSARASIVESNVVTSNIEMKLSSSIDCNSSFSLSRFIILSTLFGNSRCHPRYSLLDMTKTSDDSVKFWKFKLVGTRQLSGNRVFLQLGSSE
jgi:hypothetical protein